MTILDAAVSYDICYVPSGSRKPRSCTVLDTAPVRVRRLESQPSLFLSRDGLVWRKLDDGIGLERPCPEPALLAGRHEPGNPFFADEGTGRRRILAADIASLKIRDLVSSGRDSAAAAAQARADGVAICRSGVLAPSQGPVFWLERDKLRVADLDGLPDDFDPSTAMGPGEIDEVCAAFHAVPDRIRTGWDAGLERRGFSLVETARRVLDTGMPNRGLYNFTIAHLEAHLAYTAPDFPREEANDELAGLLEAVGDAYFEGRYANPSGAVVKSLTEQAQRAVRRWRAGSPAPALPAP